MTRAPWPAAALDPIRRVRVLAAALPGGFAETTLDVAYDRAWSWLTDLERSVPAFDAQVARLRITQRRAAPDGAEIVSFTATNLGISLRFTARIEDGFCLMRTRIRGFVVAMAAVPEGAQRTRYAQLEAVSLPGGHLLQRRFTRDVRNDLEGIRALLAAPPDGNE